jgi:hypothetical protein
VGKYYRASGDGQITIESSDRLMGEWKVISTLQSLGFGLTGKDVEGPQFFKFNEKKNGGCLLINTQPVVGICQSSVLT